MEPDETVNAKNTFGDLRPDATRAALALFVTIDREGRNVLPNSRSAALHRASFVISSWNGRQEAGTGNRQCEPRRFSQPRDPPPFKT